MEMNQVNHNNWLYEIFFLNCHSSLFNYLFLFLFYFWLCWVFATAHELSLAGATLRCGALASHCAGFSCCGAWALGARASVVVAHGL